MSTSGDDEWFLANYADGLSDLGLDTYVDRGRSKRDKIAMLHHACRRRTRSTSCTPTPTSTSTQLELVAESTVRSTPASSSSSEIFDYIEPGEELVIEPFYRLIAERQLIAVPHDGFWRNMDTFKDKMLLDEIEAGGQAALACLALDGERPTRPVLLRAARSRA